MLFLLENSTPPNVKEFTAVIYTLYVLKLEIQFNF